MAKDKPSEATPPYQTGFAPDEVAAEVRAADVVKPTLAIGDQVEVNGVGKTGHVTDILPERIEVKFVHPASEHRLTELTTVGAYHPDRVSRTLRQTAKPAL